MSEVWAVTEYSCTEECCYYSEGTSVVRLFDNEQTARQYVDAESHHHLYVSKMRIYHSMKEARFG